MAKQMSDTSRYPSRYGGGFVRHDQYLLECLCVLIARREKVNLPMKFWKQERWAKIFKGQCKAAKELLKEHPLEVILEAMRDRRCWKLQSFRAKWFLGPLLREKQRIYDAKQEQQGQVEAKKVSTVAKPRRPMGKKSLFSALKEAE